MPEHAELWACVHCGKTWSSQGLAKTCEELHVGTGNLRVKSAEPMHTGFFYPEKDRLPALIRVVGVYDDVEAVYVRLDMSQLKAGGQGIVLG